MSIKAPVKLTWEGVEYSIVIDMLLIDHIDDELNILSLARMNNPENVRLTKVSRLICILLQSAGAQVTPIEVYQGMAVNGDDKKSIFEVVAGILPFILPNFETGKKNTKSPKPKPRKAKK